ncbi:MAG TPA: hypothetical protein VH116_07140 [Gemmatimonadales bacterium]|nr:hypothetical protein [Gemmatimonadales bacterium]
MPLTSAILWMPTHATAAAEAEGAALPIFIKQHVLQAIRQPAALDAPGACIGLLLGGLRRDPDTGERWVAIESTIGPAVPVTTDGTDPVLRSALVAGRRELGRDQTIVGWYHDHPFVDAHPSPHDVDAHLACFDQPWHVAVVVARHEQCLGGVFRSSAGPDWSMVPLPFYEWRDEAAPLTNGTTATGPVWDNYHSADAPVPAPGAAARAPSARPTPTQPLLFLDDLCDDVPGDIPEDGADEFADEPKRARAAPRAVPGFGHGMKKIAGFFGERRIRIAAGGIVGVLALAGAVSVNQIVASRAAPRAVAGPQEPVTRSVLARLDAATDTLALAVAAFDIRAQLFDRRQMACPELARGLVEMESRWIVYNVARKGAFALDSVRRVRDRGAYNDVHTVERRFERSGCPRP